VSFKLAIVLVVACTLAACDGVARISDLATASENADFVFRGNVTDEQGRPMKGVLLTQKLRSIVRNTNEQRLRRVDGKYEVKERGRELRLTFSREGFHDLNCVFRSDLPGFVKTNYGVWEIQHEFPIVMVQRNRRASTLEYARINIDCSDYPRTQAVVLQRLADKYVFPVIDADVAKINSLPPGCLYVTFDEALENLSLNVSGMGGENGLVRIVPKLGYPPLQVSDVAPEGHYLQRLTFDQKRLGRLRDAEAIAIPDVAEYFFFRAGKHYGKGTFAWGEGGQVEFQLWIQTVSNDRNVCSHN